MWIASPSTVLVQNALCFSYIVGFTGTLLTVSNIYIYKSRIFSLLNICRIVSYHLIIAVVYVFNCVDNSNRTAGATRAITKTKAKLGFIVIYTYYHGMSVPFLTVCLPPLWLFLRPSWSWHTWPSNRSLQCTHVCFQWPFAHWTLGATRWLAAPLLSYTNRLSWIGLLASPGSCIFTSWSSLLIRSPPRWTRTALPSNPRQRPLRVTRICNSFYLISLICQQYKLYAEHSIMF